MGNSLKPPAGGTGVDAPRAMDASKGAFRSSVPQLPPDYSVDNSEKPGPGSYEDPLCMSGQVRSPSPSASPSTTQQSKKMFRQPKADVGLCFGSRGSRFGGPTPKDSPGPMEYNPR